MTATTSIVEQARDLTFGQEPQWLQDMRSTARNKVSQCTEPRREKQETGFLSEKGIDIENLHKTTKPQEQLIQIPEEILCLTKEEALQNPQTAAIMQQHMSTILPPTEKYTALHYTLVNNIILIYAKAGSKPEKAVIIRKQIETSNAFHHVLIIAEKDAELRIIEEEESTTQHDAGYMSTIVEVVVGDNANVTYTCMQNYDKNCTHYVNKKAQVGKDAQMHWVEAYFGAKYTRSNVTTNIEGQGGQTTNTTVFFGEEKQRLDLFSNAIQNGKNSSSSMNAIGVVKDNARSMCKGLIKIDQESHGSTGHQKAKTLLMNRDAQANAIPSMEIDNFDVRATHEASVGQVDQDKLFYLMSRGLSKEEATNQIVEGFFIPIVESLGHKETEERIKTLIQGKLKNERAEN